MTEQTRSSIRDWISEADFRSSRYLFPSRLRALPHLSTPSIRADRACLGRERWLESSAYGTRSMRRTKAAQIHRKTGNLRAVQLLLGHTKLESTRPLPWDRGR
ncbi:MAG TPA: tyrosine-type recombinase/integrase [Stellaceae bacterium]